MLKNLSIKNYLLIDDLSISFNNGFSVITGETGAGKSIIVGGISLILGKRADLSVNRDKSKKCIILILIQAVEKKNLAIVKIL